MNRKFFIKSCPTCGSDKIQLVIKNVTRKYKEQTYTIPAMEFYVCSNCGEKVYDSIAIKKIEANSPAYHHEKVLAEG